MFSQSHSLHLTFPLQLHSSMWVGFFILFNIPTPSSLLLWLKLATALLAQVLLHDISQKILPVSALPLTFLVTFFKGIWHRSSSHIDALALSHELDNWAHKTQTVESAYQGTWAGQALWHFGYGGTCHSTYIHSHSGNHLSIPIIEKWDI